LEGQSGFEVFSNTKAMICFMGILGADKMDDFKDSLATSSSITKEGGYLIGSGCLPRSCGSFESAFAISQDGGKCYVATIRPGKGSEIYGTKALTDMPPALITWVKKAR
jgi:hypothetical protein